MTILRKADKEDLELAKLRERYVTGQLNMTQLEAAIEYVLRGGDDSKLSAELAMFDARLRELET